MFRWFVLLTTSLLHSAFTACPSLATQRGPVDESTTVFLRQFCIECHGPDVQEQGLEFDTLQFDFGTPTNVRMWDRILTQVQIGDMPPADSLQPDHSVRTNFTASLEQALEASGLDLELQKRRILPQYANYIAHQTLFDGSVQQTP